jgi:hypothetical protein
MAVAWSDVAANPQFKALAPEAQEAARQQYFQTVVAPQVPAEHLDVVRQQFDAHTKDPAVSGLERVPAPDAGPMPPAPKTGLQVGPFNLPTSLSEVGDRLKASVGDVAGMAANEVNAGIGAASRPVAGIVGAVRAPFVGGPQAQSDIEGIQRWAGSRIPTTASGEEQNAALGGAMNKASNVLHSALPNNPAAQTFIPAVLDAATSVGPLAAAGVEGRLARSAAESAALASERAAPTPMQRVVQSGFKVAPNDIPAASGTPASQVPGMTLQKFTETPEIANARRQENITHSTHIAANDVKLSATDQITPEHIADAEAPPGAVYDHTGQAVRNVPADSLHPATIQALEDVAADETQNGRVPPGTQRDIRRMITGLQSGNYNGTQIVNDISSLRKVGQRSPGARVAADAMETELENQLRASGQPQTLADYQAARQTFAKIQDVKDSLKGGRIDPQAVLALRESGRPLTGGLADIAHAADVAPGSVSMPNVVKPGFEPPTTTYEAVHRGVKGAIRGVTGVLGQNLNSPEMQRKIAASARAPSPTGGVNAPPVPRPGINLEPAPGVVGREPPTQLGMALAPGPEAPPAFDLSPPPGPVVEPMQRSQVLPQATGRLNMTRDILRQIALRNGQLPGTLER